MDRFTYHYTGPGNSRNNCHLMILYTQARTIFSFRTVTAGTILNIVRKSKKWEYAGGHRYYKDSWVEELGKQLDRTVPGNRIATVSSV